MKCPRCRKVLRPQKVAAIEVDLCVACEGIWFDDGELRRLLKADPNIQETALAVSWYGTPPQNHGDIACPRCERPLNPGLFEGQDGLPLESCRARCGVWIDDGALKPLFQRSWEGAAKGSPIKNAARRLLGLLRRQSA